jgi:hypothetical protein
MVTYDGIVKCGKCKKDHKIHLEGIQDFFEWAFVMKIWRVIF